MYEQGQGTPISPPQALYWYQQAAEGNHITALYNLAVLYDEGVPNLLEPDPSQAITYYQRATELGDDDAMCSLGFKFFSSDPETSFSWFQKAAHLGNREAQYMIGNYYELGIGRQVSYAEAYHWYIQSGLSGNPAAQCALGVLFEEGKGVERNDTEAMKWYELAAEQGNADAQCNLGVMYEVPRPGHFANWDRAIYWYRKSADQGNRDAQLNLASLYYTYLMDVDLAERWYLKSAELGHPLAQYNLGIIYSNPGVRYKPKEAFEWFMKSAIQGDIHALYKVGKAHELGEGVEISLQNAIIWYDKATKADELTGEGKEALKALVEKNPLLVHNFWYYLFHYVEEEYKERVFVILLVIRNYLSKDLIMLLLPYIICSKLIEFFTVKNKNSN
jgi:TPR repeat protein